MQRMLGQIALFAFDFAPAGWMVCNGGILSIAENDQLFDLLGNKFGGDGRDNFAVPDLRKAAPGGCNYCISLEGYREDVYEGVVGETLLSVIPKPPHSEECAGQSLPRKGHELLVQYMGTRFGGDGNNFKLPNLLPFLREKFPANCYYLMYVQGRDPNSERSELLFVGELTLLPFEVTNKSLRLCNGAQIQVKDNQALFKLLGNRFGGDGVNNFKLPDLRTAVLLPPNFNYYITLGGIFPPRS